MIISDIFSNDRLIKELILKTTEKIALFNLEDDTLNSVMIELMKLNSRTKQVFVNGRRNIDLKNLSKQIYYFYKVKKVKIVIIGLENELNIDYLKLSKLMKLLSQILKIEIIIFEKFEGHYYYIIGRDRLSVEDLKHPKIAKYADNIWITMDTFKGEKINLGKTIYEITD